MNELMNLYLQKQYFGSFGSAVSSIVSVSTRNPSFVSISSALRFLLF